MSIKKLAWLLFVIVSALSVFAISGCGSQSENEQKTTAEAETQLWTCGMHPEVILDKPGNCPKCGMKLVPVKSTGEGSMAMSGADEQKPKDQKDRKILYWRAPMDPAEIYDHPGKSRMGMDLIPVYEGEAGVGAGGTINIDPVTVQNMGVRSDVVRREDFTRNIRTVGKIEYDEEKLYTVTTKISGWIEKLYVDYEGKLVRKGEPLLEIYSPELVTTQEEYLLALNTQKMVSQSSIATIRDGGESLLESTRKRLLYWDVPRSAIDKLEETGEVRKTVLLNSPARGMVVQKNAVDGMHIKEGMDLFHIADLSTIWVQASIYDNEVPWIEKGQEAEMELSYLPGKTFTGKVNYIYPYLQEKARDVNVRLVFPNPNLELKPGMYVNVKLQGRIIKNAIVIPSEAVIRSGERNVVFVVRGEGKFEPREIKIGEEGGENNNYLRVLSGLLEGEKVVISAQFLLDSESRLQEAIQKMLEEKKMKMDQSKPMDMKEHSDMDSQQQQKEMKDMDNMKNQEKIK